RAVRLEDGRCIRVRDLETFRFDRFAGARALGEVAALALRGRAAEADLRDAGGRTRLARSGGARRRRGERAVDGVGRLTEREPEGVEAELRLRRRGAVGERAGCRQVVTFLVDAVVRRRVQAVVQHEAVRAL